MIHDRGHRKPWENGTGGRGRKPHTAHYTEADDSFGSGDDENEHDHESDEGVPEEVAVAYATYQTAKQKYKEHQKSRGFQQASDNRHDQHPGNKQNERASDKIKLMKAKSFCSGCGRRGHWHKDAECPHNQGGQQKGGDENFDPGRGRDQRQVLNELPGGGGEHRGRGIGGRKCCPELSRDCYFTENEFATAYRDRHEMCVIDVEQDDRFRVDGEDDDDSFHDIPEEGEGIEVYECNEYTLEDRATFAYDSGDFSFSTCQELLDDAFSTVLKGGARRGNVIDGAKNSLVLGYYCHGGMNGVTKGAVNHTALTRYLNHFVAADNPPGATWSAISIFKGGVVKVHHDYNNAAGSRNYFASFGQTSGGELWVHDSSVTEQDIARDALSKIQWKRTGSGEWLPGRLHDSQEKFVEFDPHVKHQVVGAEGEAWQAVAYSPRETDNIGGDVKKFLKNCGFPLGGKRKQNQEKMTSRPSKK